MKTPLPHTPALPRYGDLIEVRMTELDDDGLAVARLDWPLNNETRRMRLIVRGALPGDLARVHIESRVRDTVHGRMVELIEAAPNRTEPRCRHARYAPEIRYCGGCTLQHLDYPGQLELKRQRVLKAFDVAGITVPVGQVVSAPKTFGHRHKMELSFASDRRDGETRPTDLGLHPPGLKWEVIDLEECPLTSATMSAFLPTLSAIFRRSGLLAWDPRDDQGFLRNLVIREGQRTPDKLIEILTTPREVVTAYGVEMSARDALDRLKIEILDQANTSKLEISSLLWTIHDAERGRPTRYHTTTLHGTGSLTEELVVPSKSGDRTLSFDVSPRAFFQPHPLAAENLIRQIHRRLPSTCRTVLDLYCGTGTLALTIAPSAESVLGIEIVPEAIASAISNAERNGLSHCRFIAGDVHAELSRLRTDEPEVLASVDVALLDPPRSGLSVQAVDTLVAIRPPRMIYVSCKPESLGRDLRRLFAHGYRVDGEATPVDLFPQSHHVETVVTLIDTLATEAPGAPGGTS